MNDTRYQTKILRRLAAALLALSLAAGFPVPAFAGSMTSDISISFVTEIGAACPAGTTIELWEGLMPAESGDSFTGGDGITVSNGKAALSQAREGDVYTYRVSAEGCYTVTCSFALSRQDALLQRKQIKVRLQQRGGAGYESSEVRIWSEEVEKKCFDAGSLQNVDSGILDTPSFDRGKAAHACTTLEEGKVYLRQVCGQSGHAYLYFLDDAETWPAVIFTRTDLQGVSSLQKALKKIGRDSRTKILYQAQIHGNEPAAGEGALTVARTLAEQDDALLQDMDVVLIPYASRYGARHFTRAGTSSGINLNRDGLALRAADTKKLHQVFVNLMPEVFIDGHEFNGFSRIPAQDEDGAYLKWLDDIQLTCVNNLNREPGIFEKEEAMAAKTRQELGSKGFRPYAYAASCNSTTGCNFARLYNCYTFLVESNGIGMGKAHFDRRVLSHHETVMSLLRQAAANHDEIRSTVSTARRALRQRGSKYTLSDKFVLHHGFRGGITMTMERPSFDLNGELYGGQQTDTFCNADTALRQRSRPTAYIIDKAAFGASKAKNILIANGAKCFQLPRNAKVSVRQYSGTKKKAIIGKTKKKTFKKGAYVFVMNQDAANIISASLEPDTTDTAGYSGSFVQAGILKKSGGGYPIYRYEKKNPASLKKK